VDRLVGEEPRDPAVALDDLVAPVEVLIEPQGEDVLASRRDRGRTVPIARKVATVGLQERDGLEELVTFELPEGGELPQLLGDLLPVLGEAEVVSMALLVSALTGEGCCEQLERVELESSCIDVLEDGGDGSAARLSGCVHGSGVLNRVALGL